MTIEKLFELVDLTKRGLVSNDYKRAQGIFDLLKEGKCKVISSEWLNYKSTFPHLFILDLLNWDTWCTYDHLISMEFVKKGKTKLFVDIKVTDKNYGYGYMYEYSDRWKATLQLPNTYISQLEKLLLKGSLSDYLEIEYEKYLENNKKKWMDDLLIQLLNK